jgi:hypothetical protein
MASLAPNALATQPVAKRKRQPMPKKKSTRRAKRVKRRKTLLLPMVCGMLFPSQKVYSADQRRPAVFQVDIILPHKPYKLPVMVRAELFHLGGID